MSQHLPITDLSQRAVAFGMKSMNVDGQDVEAVHAATVGGAMALRRNDVGSVTPGARADLIALDAPSPIHLAYRPGVPLVSGVWKDGRGLRALSTVDYLR